MVLKERVDQTSSNAAAVKWQWERREYDSYTNPSLHFSLGTPLCNSPPWPGRGYVDPDSFIHNQVSRLLLLYWWNCSTEETISALIIVQWHTLSCCLAWAPFIKSPPAEQSSFMQLYVRTGKEKLRTGGKKQQNLLTTWACWTVRHFG